MSQFQSLGVWKTGEEWSFRVWAPSALKVDLLIQDGDYWQTQQETRSVAMEKDTEGYWNTQIDGVAEGSLYRYQIEKNGMVSHRLDPAASDVIHSGLVRNAADSNNANILVDHSQESWPEFRTPAFECLNLYQFHVGSFAGRNDHLHDKAIASFLDVITKLDYVREMGFNAIELLPVHEFAADRSWGYNPGSFFAPESAYGSPDDLRELVKQAHLRGLAVVFDVVYNHAGPGDNVLWDFDGGSDNGGFYFEGGQQTHWGQGPAWWKQEVQNYFYQNARMFLENYHGDGLRFDATTQINGNHLGLMVDHLKKSFPDKYIIAEHLPADPWITNQGRFDATWDSRIHHEMQRALNGDQPVDRVAGILGWDGYRASWNLVKYTMGSHDDCGDQENGDAEQGLDSWDSRHRYFVDLFGGRDSWHGRAKCRVAYALNVLMPGTPMLFMGGECHMGAPHVAWGYWHDGSDLRGDHRFDWSVAGDSTAMPMRQMVTAVNQLRWNYGALRSDSLVITHRDSQNQVIAFKRWSGNQVVLCVANLSENQFGDHCYGVRTDHQYGQWTQVFCSQDASFGGWDGAGNAYYDPYTQGDGMIYINLPKWSVLLFALK